MKDDGVYLRHVLRCIARVEEYTAVGREGFFSSPLIQDGVIRNLQTLAESAQRLSELISMRAAPARSLCAVHWAPHGARAQGISALEEEGTV